LIDSVGDVTQGKNFKKTFLVLCGFKNGITFAPAPKGVMAA
jgi:hypothetical protein